MTKKTNRGFLRGVLYPLIAFVLHVFLVYVIGRGWVSDTGAVALTGLVGYIDHTVLPKTYLR